MPDHISPALEVALVMQPEYVQAQLAGAKHDEAVGFALDQARDRFRKMRIDQSPRPNLDAAKDIE